VCDGAGERDAVLLAAVLLAAVLLAAVLLAGLLLPVVMIRLAPPLVQAALRSTTMLPAIDTENRPGTRSRIVSGQLYGTSH
jgi:hypothetical protein